VVGVAILVAAAPLIAVVVGVVLLGRVTASVCLHCAVWSWWTPRGIDVLLVYSNSPIWQEYFETEIRPRLGARAVVLNWSERKQWRAGLASMAFRFFGGSKEFNPLAVVFRPFRRARVFRFWAPLKAQKHGDAEPLERLEVELFNLLAHDTRPPR
jgi:hypothetical protein